MKIATTKDWIYIGVILLLILMVVFKKSNPAPGDVLKQHAIDSLTSETVKKSDTIKIKEAQIVLYSDSIDKMNTQIQYNDEEIKELYQNYNISMEHVDTLTIGGIHDFFSDRYHDQTK